jgi:GNAT superfamily N-acetyltransferase
MPWRLTDSAELFLAMAGEHLRSDPVRHTVPLTVLDTLRHAGPAAFGDSPSTFGWHDAGGGAIDAAFLQTPPYPVLITSVPPGSASSLLDVLAAAHRAPLAVNLAAHDEPAILAAWTAATGGGARTSLRSRLFKLGELTPPDPAPPGAARVADDSDRGLLVDWMAAFARESGGAPPEDAGRIVAHRLSDRGFRLWESGGMPVALASLTREVAGVVRVSAVYTPPEHRRRSYGGAVTTAVSQAALDAGAAAVVLFTDQANPTSNALYQRLGYRPVEERLVLELTLPPHAMRAPAEPAQQP